MPEKIDREDVERFHHPNLTEEEDHQQRGDDPPSVRHDTKPEEPKEGPEDDEKTKQVQAHIERWLAERGRVRQDGFWPYLLIRAVPGDHGVRPLTVPFWESPDILVVPGIHQTYTGGATLQPTVGQPHTLFVHGWNLGRLAAVGVKLRVYWANPSFSFNDPAHSPQLIGSVYLDLPERRDPNCHQLVKLPVPWIPVLENQGHECLLATVDCFADGAGQGFDARSNRHVGQRNLSLANPKTNLSKLLAQLDEALPARADLQLLHGMVDLHTLLLVHQPELLGHLTAPATAPDRAAETPNGLFHLGAVVRTRPGSEQLVPSTVIAPVFRTDGVEPSVLTHEDVRELPKRQRPAAALLQNLGAEQLTGRAILKSLGARPNEGHVLRFQATRDGQLVGGYTIIIQN